MTDEEFEQEVRSYQHTLLRASAQINPNMGIGFDDVIPDSIA